MRLTLSDRILAARRRAELTQDELGRKVGRDLKVIGAWEKGIKAPQAGAVHALASALGVSVDWLVYGDDTPELEDGICWLAVMTGPGEEAAASLNLRAAGFYVFYPFVRVRKSRKRPNSTTKQVYVDEEPYFPRYLFVGLRGRPHETIYAINETRGVSTVVYCDGKPLPIPNSVMGAIIDKADGAGRIGAVDMLARKELAKDTLVRFVDNTPLAGLIATVSVDAGNKIKVWCEHLGRVSEITVPPDFVAEIAV